MVIQHTAAFFATVHDNLNGVCRCRLLLQGRVARSIQNECVPRA